MRLADHAGHEDPAPPRDPGRPRRVRRRRRPVAFAGEAVAVVVARSAAEARDAADLVDVDYDELTPCLDMATALDDGAPLAHPDLGTNENATWVFDSAEAGTGDDVDAAIATAREGGIVVERTFRQQRLVPAFMEPRSTVVDPTASRSRCGPRPRSRTSCGSSSPSSPACPSRRSG